MPLETPRLILRPWHEADAPALFKYAADPAVGTAADWPPHTSVEMSREVIRTVFSAPETYAVVPKATGEPAGCCGLATPHAAFIGEHEAEIGYWIGQPYWGQGLIPEAVEALAHRCFGELGLTALWIACFDANTRSRRVAEKCGFRYDRTIRGHREDGAAATFCWYRLYKDKAAAPATDR